MEEGELAGGFSAEVTALSLVTDVGILATAVTDGRIVVTALSILVTAYSVLVTALLVVVTALSVVIDGRILVTDIVCSLVSDSVFAVGCVVVDDSMKEVDICVMVVLLGARTGTVVVVSATGWSAHVRLFMVCN